jgi:hypothetical protein
MTCKNCNHYNSDAAAVCWFCGARLNAVPKTQTSARNNPPVKNSVRNNPPVRKTNPYPDYTLSQRGEARPERNKPVSSNEQSYSSRRERPVSGAREEVTEKTSVLQDRPYNKKFTSTLVFLTIIVLVCVIVFSYVFIGKYNDFLSASASPSPSPEVTVFSTPTPLMTPIVTTKPE